MKNPFKHGFTLVELLVVVLIIGILAAIALSAYQKSVEQSRAAQIWPLMKSVGNAAQMYYMSRGSMPTTFDSLSILPPSWSGTEQWYTGENVVDTRSNGEWSLQMYQSGAGPALYAGRLKGKYRGAGFYLLVRKTRDFVTEEMTPTCVERTSNGIKFEEPAGSYCVDIFNAVLDTDYSGNVRIYYMP